MKAILAYIQPFKLGRIIQELIEIPNFPGMSVFKCRGFGRDVPLGLAYDVLKEQERIEIVAPDTMVESIVEVITREAHTGCPGDGAIFICAVNEAIRIRTGERTVELT
jgi:nitrogen regulatory protein PII